MYGIPKKIEETHISLGISHIHLVVSWNEGTPNHPKLHHFSTETYGDLGIHHFKKLHHFYIISDIYIIYIYHLVI